MLAFASRSVLLALLSYLAAANAIPILAVEVPPSRRGEQYAECSDERVYELVNSQSVNTEPVYEVKADLRLANKVEKQYQSECIL